MIYRDYEFKVSRYDGQWIARVYPIPSVGEFVNPTPGFIAPSWREAANNAKQWLNGRYGDGGAIWDGSRYAFQYEEILSAEEISILERFDPRCKAMRILGLADPLSRKKVEAAFRRQAKVAHPDVGGNGEKFHALISARDLLLGNERLRRVRL